MNELSREDVARIEKLGEVAERLRAQLRKRIVGLESVIDELLVAIFSQGHVLLVGVPGLAKTLLVSSLAQSLSLEFRRIQFTPDLMPGDITGAELIAAEATGERRFVFQPGPIFANVVLADEINRTPPKTQAALIEAMEERQVTSGGKRYALDRPFFVLATQNPIEQEGTYPLPATQLDRFMFMINVDYPAQSEEYEILKLTTSGYAAQLEPLVTKDEILSLHDLVRKVAVPDELIRYAMELVRRTRTSEKGIAPAFVREWLSWGAGPRATQHLLLGAKARAMLRGRPEARPGDVRAIAPAVLRHRILPSYHAEAEGITPDDIILELIDSTAAPDRAAAAARRRGLLATLLGR